MLDRTAAADDAIDDELNDMSSVNRPSLVVRHVPRGPGEKTRWRPGGPKADESVWWDIVQWYARGCPIRGGHDGFCSFRG